MSTINRATTITNRIRINNMSMSNIVIVNACYACYRTINTMRTLRVFIVLLAISTTMIIATSVSFNIIFLKKLERCKSKEDRLMLLYRRPIRNLRNTVCSTLVTKLTYTINCSRLYFKLIIVSGFSFILRRTLYKYTRVFLTIAGTYYNQLVTITPLRRFNVLSWITANVRGALNCLKIRSNSDSNLTKDSLTNIMMRTPMNNILSMTILITSRSVISHVRSSNLMTYKYNDSTLPTLYSDTLQITMLTPLFSIRYSITMTGTRKIRI